MHRLNKILLRIILNLKFTYLEADRLDAQILLDGVFSLPVKITWIPLRLDHIPRLLLWRRSMICLVPS